MQEEEHVASFFFRLITPLMMTKVNPICYAAVSGAHSTQGFWGVQNVSNKKICTLQYFHLAFMADKKL